MAKYIKRRDKRGYEWKSAYWEKEALMLERGYSEVSPHDFYRELFPVGSLQQEPEDGKGNIIATQIRPSGKGRTRQWVIDDSLKMLDKVVGDRFGLIPPISFYGKSHTKENAHELFAVVVDVDYVGKQQLKNLLKQLSVSFWALAAVLIVVFGVVGGVFTATESAAVAVIYSLIVSVFIYKGLDWKGVWRVLGECVDTLSIVLILIATSSIFGYCLTRLHVPDLAAQAIVGLTSNPILIALLLNLILLVLGCIMDMAPIILIATPILLPIATSIGIDPIQFGIMVVLNCGIGLLTPPVGAVLFIGSAVAKIPMEKVVKATLPFYLCMIITLLLVTFVPAISMFIPNLLK